MHIIYNLYKKALWNLWLYLWGERTFCVQRFVHMCSFKHCQLFFASIWHAFNQAKCFVFSFLIFCCCFYFFFLFLFYIVDLFGRSFVGLIFLSYFFFMYILLYTSIPCNSVIICDLRLYFLLLKPKEINNNAKKQTNKQTK